MPLHPDRERPRIRPHRADRLDGLDDSVLGSSADPHSIAGSGDGLVVEAVHAGRLPAQGFCGSAARFQRDRVSPRALPQLMGRRLRQVERELDRFKI